MDIFENLSSELFKQVEKEELNAMKGGVSAYENTLTIKSSDPTWQDVNFSDPAD